MPLKNGQLYFPLKYLLKNQVDITFIYSFQRRFKRQLFKTLATKLNNFHYKMHISLQNPDFHFYAPLFYFLLNSCTITPKRPI